MSLTDFIEQDSIRQRFSDTFPNRGSRASHSVSVPWQTDHYMLVGRAFNYLLRFYLKYHSRQPSSTGVTEWDWLASQTLTIVSDTYDSEKQSTTHDDISVDEEQIRSVLSSAREHRDEYLASGEFSRPLIESALDLARLDRVYYDTSYSLEYLAAYDDQDIVDCLYLLKELDDSWPFETSQVYLHPRFGFASELVGGAEADFIVDQTLLKPTVSSKRTFKAQYWRQLVGYLLLLDLHNDFVEHGLYEQFDIGSVSYTDTFDTISEFGIYFTRHGEASTTSTRAIYDDKRYEQFRSWFVDTALEQQTTFSAELTNAIRDIA